MTYSPTISSRRKFCELGKKEQFLFYQPPNQISCNISDLDFGPMPLLYEVSCNIVQYIDCSSHVFYYLWGTLASKECYKRSREDHQLPLKKSHKQCRWLHSYTKAKTDTLGLCVSVSASHYLILDMIRFLPHLCSSESILLPARYIWASDPPDVTTG